MGRPPAYLFVVRHGFRLDIADKQWHLSSPTPYDPPLTYGGWQQAKMLGARIGSIIRERALKDEEDAKQLEEQTDGTTPTKRKRRKYKIVLHSSPFLRCIQTSVAISAGLAQDTPYLGTPRGPTSSPLPSPGTRPTIVTDFSGLGSSDPIRKTVLRLDAFLGEWMNPDYFELITPPPESVMMLASAKADLLRRENYQSYPGFSANGSATSQGQLWGSPASAGQGTSNGLESLSGMATSLPSNGIAGGSQSPQPRPVSVSSPPATSGYIAPVPTYAISSGAPIPMGFVSHAKDACTNIDYQWDSMRDPLDWGSGGEYGEEWANMHKRFRKGLQMLVDWYSTEDSPTEMVTKMAMPKASEGMFQEAVEDPEGFETESIVILVSHGAGCNAMIGAITHQPALTEVSMASLTMAVRKEGMDTSDAHHDDPFERATHDKTKGLIPLHRFYDMRIIGSTEHLRSATPTPSSARSPAMAGVFGGTRGRHSNSLSSTLGTFSYSDAADSRSSSANAALSNMRRTSDSRTTGARSAFGVGTGSGGITVGSGRSSFTSTATRPFTIGRTPSIGLWSPITPPGEDEDDDDDDDDMLLNFSHEKEPRKPKDEAPVSATTTSATQSGSGTETSGQPKAERPPSVPVSYAEGQSPATLSKLGLSPGGLWSASPPSSAVEETLHDMSSTKRRWTVNERA